MQTIMRQSWPGTVFNEKEKGGEPGRGGDEVATVSVVALLGLLSEEYKVREGSVSAQSRVPDPVVVGAPDDNEDNDDDDDELLRVEAKWVGRVLYNSVRTSTIQSP